jgi:PAS domain S-box-containing protein/putative nucleotidyltransferase with HDIG domain
MTLYRMSNAFRIAAIYAIVGALWILLSDKIVYSLAPNQETASTLATYKGWAFVFVTAYLLYWERKKTGDALSKNNVHLLQPVRAPGQLGFILAVILPFIALGLQWMLWPYVSPFVWFFFFPTVFFSARLGGLRGGLFSTLLSSAIVWYFFLDPQLSWKIGSSSHIFSIIVFFVMGYLISDSQQRLNLANRLAHTALLESEERFSLILRTNPNPMLIVSKNGQIVQANEQAEKTFGYEAGTLPGIDIDSLVPDRIWETHETNRAKYIGDTQPLPFLPRRGVFGRRRDGSEFPAEVTIGPLRIRGESYIVSTVIDITERKLADDNLRKNESLYRELVQNANSAIIRWKRDGTITFFNEYAEKFFGYRAEEILGRDVNILVPRTESTGGDLTSLVQNIVDHPERFINVINENICRDGHRVWMTWTNKPIRDENGDVTETLAVGADITERKRVESALRENEKLLHQALEASKGGIWEWNLQTNENVWSEELWKIYGLEPFSSKPSYESWLSTIHPDDRAGAAQTVQDAAKNETELNAEWRVVDKDGAQRWLMSRGRPMRDASGQAVRYLGIVLDITERKQAEEALRQNELKHRMILESMVDNVVILDAEGKIQYINHVSPGLSNEEVLGSNWLMWLDEANRAIAEQAIQQTMTTGEVTEVEYRAVGAGRKTNWFRVKFVRMPDASAQRVLLIAMDISVRRQAEEAVRQTEKRFKALIEKAPDGIVLVGPQNNFTYVSPSAKKMFGYGGDDPITTTPNESTHPDDLPAVLTALQSLLQDPSQVPELQYRFKNKDGSWRWIESTFSNLLAEPGVEAIVINFRDITERRQAQQQIEEQIARLNALRSIDLVISSNFDLKPSLNLILPHIIEQLGVDAADVLTFDPIMYQLEYAAGAGFLSNPTDQARGQLTRSLAGEVILKGKPLYVPNLRQHADESGRLPFSGKEKFTSYYAVPLIAKGYVKGVLEVFSRKQLNPRPDWVNFLDALAHQAAIAIDNIRLFNDLQRSNYDLIHAYDLTIEGWSNALDLRDKETEGHTLRVTDLTMKLVREMGIPEGDIIHIRRGALLHDIGKMGVPDHILFKPGPLTDEEWVIMRQHPIHAYNLLSRIEFLRPALNIPHYHHEKWDGTGYPEGLKGKQIPLEARAFAVIDVWDALRSDRPYRKSWPGEKVREYLMGESGRHFDPHMVDTFLSMKL